MLKIFLMALQIYNYIGTLPLFNIEKHIYLLWT